MNILIIGPDFKPLQGGVAEYTHRLALHLHESKDRVLVLSERMNGAAIFDTSCPYAVHRHDFRFISSGPIRKYLKGYWWLRKFAEAHAPIDIIISNCRDLSSVTALAVSRSLHIPFVLLTHGLEINRKKTKERMITKFLLKGTSRVFCNSKYTQTLVKDYGIPLSKTTIVPGAIAINEYPATLCRSTKHSRKGSNKCKTVLTCGKLTERKGQDMVIQALPKILQEFGNVVYVIAGTGPYEMELRKLVDNLNLDENVAFKGRVSTTELYDLYRSCDLFAMPCRELKNGDVEGFGLVFLEANAFCKPVVAGKSGGVSDAVQHGKTGIMVDPTDPDKIASAILYLLKNPKTAAQMGEFGRRRVKKEFTWQKSGTKLRQVLMMLTQQGYQQDP